MNVVLLLSSVVPPVQPQFDPSFIDFYKVCINKIQKPEQWESLDHNKAVATRNYIGQVHISAWQESVPGVRKFSKN
jgi:hypothetical protein